MIARMRSSSLAIGRPRRAAEDRRASLGLAEVGAEVDADALTARGSRSRPECPTPARETRPLPRSAVVTPIISLLSASPLRGRIPPDWSIMSIQPGETYMPAASISLVPRSGTRPIFAKRPSVMATSARIHGLPAPSSTRPLPDDQIVPRRCGAGLRRRGPGRRCGHRACAGGQSGHEDGQTRKSHVISKELNCHLVPISSHQAFTRPGSSRLTCGFHES